MEEKGRKVLELIAGLVCLLFAEHCRCSGHNPQSKTTSRNQSIPLFSAGTAARHFFFEEMNELDCSLGRPRPSTLSSFQSTFPFSKRKLKKRRELNGQPLNFTTCFLHKNQINLVFMLSASCSINLLL